MESVETRLKEDFCDSNEGLLDLVEDLTSLSEEIAERRLLVDRLVASGQKLGVMGAAALVSEADEINARYLDLRENCREKKREIQQLHSEQNEFLDRLTLLQSEFENFKFSDDNIF